jgi:alanine-glyoxylate transaminase/serine-glyoxylate transaminase/serine-pyruvate transaminase
MPDHVLTMIPGPTPVDERILAALGRPTVSHQAPGFVESFRACLANLREIALSKTAQPFVVAGSGTLAMEMALVNLVAPGEQLLVVSQGYFGDRWSQLAEAFGIRCDHLQAEWGTTIPPEQLARQLEGDSYAAVALTHVDTSTGAAAPVAAYCELLRDRSEHVLLDGVCATAGIEERFDDWGLDVLITGAQKAFGTPPGLAILLASVRAMERRESLGAVPAYFADLLRWLPIMHDPTRYFSTPPVNELLALHQATQMILEEGIARRFERHARIAVALRAGLDVLKLELFTAPASRADTLSVVRYPDNVDDATFRASMAGRGVIVAAALGTIAGKAFRIGHMGNIGIEEVCRTLDAIEASLADQGLDSPAGRAADAARTLMQRS